MTTEQTDLRLVTYDTEAERDNAIFNSQSAIPSIKYLGFNKTNKELEYYNGTSWGVLGTSNLNVIASGFVGIDYSVPETRLNVNGTTRHNQSSDASWLDIDDSHIEFNSAGNVSYIDQNGIGGTIQIRVSDAGALDTTAIYIASDGKVGIGAVPEQELHVEGNIQFAASPGMYSDDGAFKFFPTDGDQACSITLEPSGVQDSTAVYLKGDTGNNYHGFMFNQDGKSTYIRNEIYGSGSPVGVRRMLLQMSGTTAIGIGTNGDVTIGDASWPSANGGKVLSFADNTSDPTMAANTSGIYAKDVAGTVELFAIDEAGNVTQLSPHDSKTGEWIYHSKNVKTGITKRVNMEALVSIVESLSGKTLLEVENDVE